MKPAKLMTNITPNYYAFIEKEAKRQQKPKREIVEEAIRLYMKESYKRQIEQSYKKMAEDKDYLKEMVDMAEEGMEYYLKDIDQK